MKPDTHRRMTELVFDLLKEIEPNSFLIYEHKDKVAEAASFTDHLRDMEFIKVKGTKDTNPHAADANDENWVRWSSHYFTTFNHFIDIKNGSGRFDDYDGYSYKHGSASNNECQMASEAYNAGDYDWLVDYILDSANIKVDEGINLYMSICYVHTPGREGYNKCSEAVERYSFITDLGNYSNKREEANSRFPVALSSTIDIHTWKNNGIPASVFMPIDNMARYWFSLYLSNEKMPVVEYGPETDTVKRQLEREEALGMVMHAIQDASVPHHAAGICGNWHKAYERYINDSLLSDFINNTSIREEIKALYSDMCQTDDKPPNSLTMRDRTRCPRSNWRIDFLVTWIALTSYKVYKDVYKWKDIRKGIDSEGKRVKDFYSTPSSLLVIKDLFVKSVAVCMLALKNAIVSTNEAKQKRDTLWFWILH